MDNAAVKIMTWVRCGGMAISKSYNMPTKKAVSTVVIQASVHSRVSAQVLVLTTWMESAHSWISEGLDGSDIMVQATDWLVDGHVSRLVRHAIAALSTRLTKERLPCPKCDTGVLASDDRDWVAIMIAIGTW